jgi:HK97 family phage prohead protease
MPYYISDNNPDCEGYAVQKENGEVVGCHRTEQEAIDQMIAISLAEGIEPGGYIENDDDDEKSVKQYQPPEGAREEARRGLEWRREFGRGGTEVGVARARDISNGRNLSEETIIRMVSYFARHEVDKEAEGFRPGEEGYPSNGRIAWALWGGDPGKSWAERILSGIEREREKRTELQQEEHKMQVKSFPLETLEVKAKGTTDAPYGEFTALVSVFNNTDLVGDRVLPGAFASSLAKYTAQGKNLPIVWSHDWGNAESFIGKTISATETTEGLLIRGAFFDTPRAQTVRTLLAEKVVNEFSFAYDIVTEQKGEDGINELVELHILEAGPTLKGANPATQLIAAKAIAKQNSKAEPDELQEGSWVTFDDGYGRVEYIMTEGSFGVEGDELSLEATADDPLAMVRIYQEINDAYQPTDLFRGFRFSELELSEQKSKKKKLKVDNYKAGRTLSRKNEGSIRQAKDLLDEVLNSLETEPAEPVKTEESAVIKDEERGLDPEIAISLLELNELDTEN